MRNIGVLIGCGPSTDVKAEFIKAQENGLQSCQLCIWNQDTYTDEKAAEINAAVEETGFIISTLWAGWSGPKEWNFSYGPSTLGLVPEAYRMTRLMELRNAADFAVKIHVDKVATHVGFLPENPDDPLFAGTVGALRNLCTYMEARGLYFLFETGQETPVTLRRVIEDVGTGNLGINLDPANLILYGKGNPVDALDVFGEYVCDIHAKDGKYPTNGHDLGEETIVGAGKVNFPKFVETLKSIGYNGTMIIEREIWGEQQIKDINDTKIYLEELIG